MKLPKELLNGFIIFFGIAIYFILMEILGLSDNSYLRMFNVLFVYYGVHRTLKANFEEGKGGYFHNLTSSGLTGLIGVVLSVIGLMIYIYYMGGKDYIETNLSKTYFFGGSPSINAYCFGILFEGIASAIIVAFVSMQYWRRKLNLND